MEKMQDYAWRDHPVMFVLGVAAYTGTHLPKIVMDGCKEIHSENKKERLVNRHLKACERYKKTLLKEGRISEDEAKRWMTQELEWAVRKYNL